MTETLEVTTLRPAEGLTTADFVTANADIDAYLQRQPGFQWRRILETGNGTIIDIVAYESMSEARSGAAGITGEMGDSPVHDTIDHASVDWNLTTVVHRVESATGAAGTAGTAGTAGRAGTAGTAGAASTAGQGETVRP